jgi:hypothetical protein
MKRTLHISPADALTAPVRSRPPGRLRRKRNSVDSVIRLALEGLASALTPRFTGFLRR